MRLIEAGGQLWQNHSMNTLMNNMNEVLNKITSYKLFNYLLPGILFVVLLETVTSYSLIQESLVFGAIVYYFAGLVISRLGSLIIEPVLKIISFLKFAPYKDFVSAAKSDSKIDVLLEENNMYRSFVSMLVLLLLLKAYELSALTIPILNQYGSYILIVLLLIMFLFSYRKQTGYINKRIEANKPE